MYYFNPRSPWGERLGSGDHVLILVTFQSTLPVGGATVDKGFSIATWGISIHAPRGGSDRSMSLVEVGRETSIHAPRGGSDPITPWAAVWPIQFQSTLPVRGATSVRAFHTKQTEFQSTLPVRGATRTQDQHVSDINNFNPRSP